MAIYNDVKNITSLYLYGSELVPSDLLADDIVREASASSVYDVDVASLMQNGAGRFALGAAFNIIQAFFESPPFILGPGIYSKSELADLFNLQYYGLTQSNWKLQDSNDDYAERTYLYNTIQYWIRDGARFVIEDIGGQIFRRIENLVIEPLQTDAPDNFDLDGGDFFTNIGNDFLESQIDPSGIGRTVNYNYINSSSIASRIYDLDDYSADQVTMQSWFGADVIKLYQDISDLTAQLFNDGITRFLDGLDRPIIYAPIDGGQFGQSTAESAHYLKAYVGNGVRIIGSLDDDYLLWSNIGSVISGGGGDDEFNFQGGSSTVVFGGAGNNTFNIGNEQKGSLFVLGGDVDVVRIDFAGRTDEDGNSIAAMAATNRLHFDNAAFSALKYTPTLWVSSSSDLTEADLVGAANDRVFSHPASPSVNYIMGAGNHELYVGDIKLTGGVVNISGSSNAGFIDNENEFIYQLAWHIGVNGEQVYSGFLSIYHYPTGFGMNIMNFRQGDFGIFLQGDGPIDPNPWPAHPGFTLKPPGFATFQGDENSSEDLIDFMFRSRNEIVGTDGSDYIVGTILNDQIYAGGGDDNIVAGSGLGDDFYHGGSGLDRIIFSSTTLGINVDLAKGIAWGSEIGSDQLVSIESVLGGRGSDYVVGSRAAEIFEGAEGDDWLAGGAGDDTYIYNRGDGQDTVEEGATGGASDVLYINGVNAYTQTVLTAVGYDLRIEIDPSSPSAGDGGSILLKNQLRTDGDHGVEIIYDGASNIFTKQDIFLFMFGNSSGGISMSGSTGDDQLLGTEQADEFYGGNGNDYLFGAAGNDALHGGSGDDVIEGGAGNDWLVGGSGADTFIFRSGFGQDGIGDFEVGVDILEFLEQSTLDFAGLMASAEEWGGNAWLHFDGGNRVILYGVGLDDLSASDFRFV